MGLAVGKRRGVGWVDIGGDVPVLCRIKGEGAVCKCLVRGGE